MPAVPSSVAVPLWRDEGISNQQGRLSIPLLLKDKLTLVSFLNL